MNPQPQRALEPQVAIYEQAALLKPKPGSEARLAALTNTRGLAADKFSGLAARLRQLQSQRPLRTVLVTSSGEGDGKSVVAANLAVTLARDGRQKVALIEGDLRQPSFGRMFGFNGLKGLSDFVQGGGSVSNFMYRVQAMPLWIVPAGTATGNPTEVLQSDRVSEIVAQDGGWFDWVIIDSPPLLPWSDASQWNSLADGTLLVVREGKTSKKLLQSALETVEAAKLLGVVVNESVETGYGNYGTNGQNGSVKL
jgi:capsular exopolysaccharide synthesis family protein